MRSEAGTRGRWWSVRRQEGRDGSVGLKQKLREEERSDSRGKPSPGSPQVLSWRSLSVWKRKCNFPRMYFITPTSAGRRELLVYPLRIFIPFTEELLFPSHSLTCGHSTHSSLECSCFPARPSQARVWGHPSEAEPEAFALESGEQGPTTDPELCRHSVLTKIYFPPSTPERTYSVRNIPLYGCVYMYASTKNQKHSPKLSWCLLAINRSSALKENDFLAAKLKFIKTSMTSIIKFTFACARPVYFCTKKIMLDRMVKALKA